MISFWNFIVPEASPCQCSTLVLDLGLQFLLHLGQSRGIPLEHAAWNYQLPNLELLPEVWSLSLCVDFLCPGSPDRGTDIPTGFRTQWCAKVRSHSETTFILGVLNLIHCVAAEAPWNPSIVCYILCVFKTHFFFSEKGLKFWFFSQRSL